MHYPLLTVALISLLLVLPLGCASTSTPSLTPIPDSLFQVGTQDLIASGANRTAGVVVTFNVNFGTAVTSPGLAISLGRFSIKVTSGFISYILAPNTLASLTSTGFVSRGFVLSPFQQVIYATTMQYLVYSKGTPLTQALQLSTAYSAISTSNFTDSITNYHTQSLTLDRTLVQPRTRYLTYTPTCIVYNLGNQINLGGTITKYGVSTTCTAAFGGNTAEVRVTGSEEVSVTSIIVSVLVYVQHEAGYFGYFEDPLLSSPSPSQQYLFVSVPTLNSLDPSSPMAKLTALIPLAPAPNRKLSYGITSITVASLASIYSHSFASSTGAITLSNHQPTLVTAVPEVMYNLGAVLLLGLISCANSSHYYDRVGGLCYEGWTGGSRLCSGMEYVSSGGSAGVPGSIGVTLRADKYQAASLLAVYTSLKSSNNNTILQANGRSAEDTQSVPSGPTRRVVTTQTNQFIIYGNNLYHTNTSALTLVSSLAELTLNNSQALLSAITPIVDPEQRIIDAFMAQYNTSYDIAPPLEYRLLSVIDNRLNLYLYLLCDNPITASPETMYLGYSEVVAATVTTTLRGSVGNASLAVEDIMASIEGSNRATQRVLMRVLGRRVQNAAAGLKAGLEVQVVLDNNVWVFEQELIYNSQATSHAGGATILGQYQVSTSPPLYLLLHSHALTPVHSQTLPIAVSYSAGPTAYPLSISCSQPYTSRLPSLLATSNYSYLSTLYSPNYYNLRSVYLTYVMSDGQVLVYGSRGLDTHYSNANSINFTAAVNYTRIYDSVTGTVLQESDVASIPYLQSGYTYTPSAGYSYQPITIDMGFNNTTLSSLASDLGGSPTVRLLFQQGHGSDVVQAQMTSLGDYLLILTNVNLLYIYGRQTLAPTGTFTAMYSYKLQRMVDLDTYMRNRTNNGNNLAGGSRELGLGLQLDEQAGLVYVTTNAGNLYKIDCGWGARQQDSQGGMENRLYGFRYVQLDIPVPVTPVTPVTPPVTPNNTNNNNNNTTVTTDATTPTQTQTGLSQTVIIVISVLGGVVGLIALLLVYFLLIKPAVPSISASAGPKIKTQDTKMDIQELNQTQFGDRTQGGTQRIVSGKTEVTSLSEFKHQRGLKYKSGLKIRDMSKASLQSNDTLITDTPYGRGRGLIPDTKKTVVIEELEV